MVNHFVLYIFGLETKEKNKLKTCRHMVLPLFYSFNLLALALRKFHVCKQERRAIA
jgi:hypothetical protein